MSSFHLPRRDDLGQFRVLVVPDMSGLTTEETQALADYARQGGQVLLTGQATLYDATGQRLDNFALGDRLGLQFERVSQESATVVPATAWDGGQLPSALTNLTFVATRPLSGTTLASVIQGGRSWPLIHVQPTGRGRFVYLATNRSRELTTALINWLRGPPPVVTLPADKRAYLTWQAHSRRWVLHLLHDGDYTVDIRKDYATPTRVVARYPASGWNADLRKTEAGVRVAVSGGARNRLLTLE